MTLADFLQRLNGVTATGTDNEYKALCPSHDDRQQSLSIGEGDDGRILIHCHAGCSPETVVNSMGLNMRDLMPPSKNNSSKPRQKRRWGKIVETYDYMNADGTKLLYQAVRMEPKDFRQRRPDPNGKDGWVWSVKGIERVPYRLPNLFEAVNAGQSTIYIAEGEKDVNRLWQLGLPATTNAGGAGKWGQGESNWIGKLPGSLLVAIIPDNDEPGREHANKVAWQLAKLDNVRNIKMLTLPDVGEKGDVSDWLDAGHTRNELEQIVQEAADWDPVAPGSDRRSQDEQDEDDILERLNAAREIVAGLLEQAAADTVEAIKMALTDKEVVDALTLVSDQERGTFEAACIELREKGATARDVAAVKKTVNAEKRKRRHLRAVSYDDASRGSTEIFFEGTEFVPARLEAVLLDEFHFAYTADTLYVYQDGVYVPHGVETVARRAKELLGEEFRENRVKETVYHISVSCGCRPEELNKDANRYITVLNGRYDWIEGKLVPHDPEALTTLQIPVTYDPNATCPVIDGFFRDVLPADAVPLVEEMFGYAMIPDTRFEKAFMLTGSGSNGKSTLLKLLETFIGSYNISKIPLQELDENRFKRADLFGKLVNLFADLDSRALQSSSYFKTVVSGDSIDAERKNRDPFYFRPFARLIFSANEIPGSRDKSFAYYRRWAILPFPNQFTGENADKALGSKLIRPEELSGLFLRAVEGLQRLFANEEFTMPASVQEALHRYQIANDSARAFLEECCEEADEGSGVFKQAVYNSYVDFCKASNFQPVSQRKFNARVEEVYPHVFEDRNTPGGRMWRGLLLSI